MINSKILNYIALSAALQCFTVAMLALPVEANPLKDRVTKITKKVGHITHAVIQLPSYIGLHFALGLVHWYTDEVREK